VTSTPDSKDAHITVVYGNKPADHTWIHAMVQKAALTTADLDWSRTVPVYMQPAHLAAAGLGVWAIEPHAPKLERLKAALGEQFAPHLGVRLIAPHITLCMVKCKPELDALFGTGPIALSVRFPLTNGKPALMPPKIQPGGHNKKPP